MVRTKLNYAAETHPGLVRANNEDRVYVDAGRGIFLVVDGVGGHAAGEKAAEVAVNRIRRRLERQTGAVAERIREAIAVANNEIFQLAATNPEWNGMACVLTVAVVEDGLATVGHVGDSRLYKIGGKTIQKITHDHSPVGEREEAGELTEAEAMRHPRRNEVYRDAGSEEHAPDDADFIEVQSVPFEPDCALLLCSDGLSDQVASSEILRIVQRHAGDPDAAIHELIEAANRAGGKDNVSIVLVEGDQFAVAVPKASGDSKPNNSFLTGRAAFFLYGILLALLAAGFAYKLRPSEPPVPVVLLPRLLTVGPGAAVSSIVEALAQARPGDTIEVLAGEYRETLRLKSGITVRSRVPREAILRAPVSETPGVSVIAEGIHNARIVGFQILADDKMPLATGILLADSDVEIEDMEIAGAGTGIEIRGRSNPVLRANAIRDNLGEGVVISGLAAPWLSHNSIVRNKRAGLVATAPARPALMGNILTGNGGQAVVLPAGTSMEPIKKFNYILGGRR